MLQFFQKLFYFHAYEFDYEDKHGYMNAANTVKYDSYNKVTKYKIMSLICAELAGDFHLGYARQLTDKSSLLFDLAF